jgi:predicted esterase
MKKIMLMVILVFGLAQGPLFSAETQPRPGYLDEPVQLKIIGEIREGERYPLMIFLPFTTGSAEQYFSQVSPYIGLDNYFAIIPQGTAQVADYLPDFYSYLLWFEKRLMTDLKEILKNNPIDPDKIYINGYSLGGDLSWALLIRQKELLAGAFILGSRCSYVPNKKDLKYLKEHKKKIVLLMGDKDLPDRVKGMVNAARLAEKNGLTYWHWTFEGEHIIPPQELKKVFELLLGTNNSGNSAAAPVPSGKKGEQPEHGLLKSPETSQFMVEGMH